MMNERTLALADERDRLDERLDELADKIVAADDPTTLQQVASQVETRLSGVAYLCSQYDPEAASVTVRGLTAGEYARVEDRLAAMRDEADGDRIPGSETNVFAAAGLVAAPFIDDRDPDLDTALQAVAGQPIGVAKWLESRVNEETTVEGNGYARLSERIAARRGD